MAIYGSDNAVVVSLIGSTSVVMVALIGLIGIALQLRRMQSTVDSTRGEVANVHHVVNSAHSELVDKLETQTEALADALAVVVRLRDIIDAGAGDTRLSQRDEASVVAQVGVTEEKRRSPLPPPLPPGTVGEWQLRLNQGGEPDVRHGD